MALTMPLDDHEEVRAGEPSVSAGVSVLSGDVLHERPRTRFRGSLSLQRPWQKLAISPVFAEKWCAALSDASVTAWMPSLADPLMTQACAGMSRGTRTREAT